MTNPRLVVTTGPLQGTTFALSEEEVSIGREPTNRLWIKDNRSVSRRHCLVKREGDQFIIRDLDSRNGTFVNELPVKERLLEHGDQIQIGDSLLLFLLEEDETPLTSTSIQLEEGTLVTVSMVRLRNEESLYLQPEKVEAELPLTARLTRNLNALLRISTAVNSLQEPKALQQRLLQLTFEVVPAEQGAILLVGESRDEFASVLCWDKHLGPDPSVHPSRTIVQQVLREGTAILSNNILQDETFKETESLMASEVRSVLCVPLQLFERKLGVIYLVTRDPLTHFNEDHLQLATAVAAIATGALENARLLEWLKNENQRMQTSINLEHDMVGESAQMRQVHQLIARAAPTDSTILILGESGTGKELVARAIHQNSPRAGRPFMAINCAAIPETLLESELFGTKKGAYTEATDRKGRLETANGGMVFLDEIAEMSLPLQAKLLRVLQERKFERVGDTRTITVDLRWVAATNKDLREAVQRGTFRDDLYFRLNVISVKIPPLRERREDIPLLAHYFVAKHCKECKRPLMGISPEARARLIHYDWPGNVRELDNAIERAVVLGSANLILPEDLPETVMEREPPPGIVIPKIDEAVREAKKQKIRQALEQAGGNKTEAAKLLGIHPNNLHRLIRNLNLK